MLRESDRVFCPLDQRGLQQAGVKPGFARAGRLALSARTDRLQRREQFLQEDAELLI